ncbi:MAG TPA: response regulator transcription factor [Opitutaceae bacterium]|nr:response regulator transcription factor [Opitutaceae bacterium]HRJ47425.1 response regulator transcription factor [Opitutaceae bacterium]
MPHPLKVLLVDDHPLVREGVRACLAPVAHLNVVGEAADGGEALRLTRLLEPDVVLMDVNMPGMSGLEATVRLQREAPGVRVLALTIHDRREYVLQLMHAGAAGYVTKEAPPAELIRAIEVVARGGSYFSSQAARALRPDGETVKASKLTAREREVLALVAEGLSNKDIASRLRVEVRTIESHRSRLMDKLDIHSVAGLTRYALAQGYVQLE